MNLYLKQKAFSWHDKAEVLDPEGQVRYTVEGDSIWSKKLHIRDVNGTEVAFLREKAWSWKPTFYMEAGGEVVAEIRRKGAFSPVYLVAGPNWEVEGTFSEHNYTIWDNGRAIGRIRKELKGFGDAYRITIADDVVEPAVVAVVLAIDAVLDAEAAAAAAT